MILAFNGKYGGGKMILNPLAMINDGYFEFCYGSKILGFSGCIKLFDGAKKGGVHVYDNDGHIYRCKKLKLINKSKGR